MIGIPWVPLALIGCLYWSPPMASAFVVPRATSSSRFPFHFRHMAKETPSVASFSIRNCWKQLSTSSDTTRFHLENHPFISYHSPILRDDSLFYLKREPRQRTIEMFPISRPQDTYTLWTLPTDSTFIDMDVSFLKVSTGILMVLHVILYHHRTQQYSCHSHAWRSCTAQPTWEGMWSTTWGDFSSPIHSVVGFSTYACIVFHNGKLLQCPWTSSHNPDGLPEPQSPVFQQEISGGISFSRCMTGHDHSQHLLSFSPFGQHGRWWVQSPHRHENPIQHTLPPLPGSSSIHQIAFHSASVSRITLMISSHEGTITIYSLDSTTRRWKQRVEWNLPPNLSSMTWMTLDTYKYMGITSQGSIAIGNVFTGELWSLLPWNVDINRFSKAFLTHRLFGVDGVRHGITWIDVVPSSLYDEKEMHTLMTSFQEWIHPVSPPSLPKINPFLPSRKQVPFHSDVPSDTSLDTTNDSHDTSFPIEEDPSEGGEESSSLE